MLFSPMPVVYNLVHSVSCCHVCKQKLLPLCYSCHVTMCMRQCALFTAAVFSSMDVQVDVTSTRIVRDLDSRSQRIQLRV